MTLISYGNIPFISFWIPVRTKAFRWAASQAWKNAAKTWERSMSRVKLTWIPIDEKPRKTVESNKNTEREFQPLFLPNKRVPGCLRVHQQTVHMQRHVEITRLGSGRVACNLGSRCSMLDFTGVEALDTFDAYSGWYWLVVTGTMEFYDFPFSWECPHPSWLSYFSEGLKPPTSIFLKQHTYALFSYGEKICVASKMQSTWDFLLYLADGLPSNKLTVRSGNHG